MSMYGVSGSRIALLAAAAPGDREARPRTDVELLAEATGATLVPPPPPNRLRSFENLVASDLRHGLAARSVNPEVCVSFAERTATAAVWCIPKARHICVAHNFNRSRRALQQLTRWMHRLDGVVVVSSRQRELLLEAGLPAEKVHFFPDYVDTEFFDPTRVIDGELSKDTEVEPGYILAVGQEGRDYRLLLSALADAETRAIIVPSSAWVETRTLPTPLPGNVTVRTRIPFKQLRQLYRGASAVVVPVVENTQYAAGVNALLEGLSMGRPVIVSDTPGLKDYLNEDYMTVITPNDRKAIVQAIRQIDTQKAAGARQEALKQYSIEGYVAKLVAVLR